MRDSIWWLRLRLTWGRIKMAYYIRKYEAEVLSATTLLDRLKAKYPELFKEDG